MLLQNNYSYSFQQGVPGGLFDSSPRSVLSRTNGEPSGAAIKYGMGVVRGNKPGVEVLLPIASSAAVDFEGVILSDISERDMGGQVVIDPTKTLGVMDWGKVWVRVADGLTIEYGDPVYLIKDGADVGKFTNDSGSGGILIKKAQFIKPVSDGDLSVIELYNAPNV